MKNRYTKRISLSTRLQTRLEPANYEIYYLSGMPCIHIVPQYMYIVTIMLYIYHTRAVKPIGTFYWQGSGYAGIFFSLPQAAEKKIPAYLRISEKDVPPLLPEAQRCGRLPLLRGGLRRLAVDADDRHRVLAGANIAKLLAGLGFDHRGLLVVPRQTLQVGVVSLRLLELLLRLLHMLLKLAVRPCLRQRRQQKARQIRPVIQTIVLVSIDVRLARRLPNDSSAPTAEVT